MDSPRKTGESYPLFIAVILRGSFLLKADLRMLMKIVPDGDKLAGEGRKSFDNLTLSLLIPRFRALRPATAECTDTHARAQ
jgi:hypothetical protein